MTARWAILVVSGATLGGCALPEQGSDFTSDVPAERVNAAARAARDRDRSKARDLVDCLESSDPGLRLIAIRTLADMNQGETLGYQHAIPASRQPEAMKRWRAWADLQRAGDTPSPGQPSKAPTHAAS